MKFNKVLVIGDLIIDKYVYGEVKRISPEAPVPVLNSNKFFTSLGGAGNVAKCISALNNQVDFVFNKGVASDFEINESNINAISFNDDRILTVKTRYISRGNHILRVDNENTKPLSKAIELELNIFLKENLKSYDYVIVSDYNKGFLSSKILQTISSECRLNNVKSYLDPKFGKISSYKNFDIIKCNKNEMEYFAGKKIFSEKELKKEIQKIYFDLNCEVFICTLSSKGHLCFDGKNFYKFDTKAIEVYDVSGAGDSFISSFAYFFNKNKDLEKSSIMASASAAISVTKMGCYSPTLDEINKFTNEKKD